MVATYEVGQALTWECLSCRRTCVYDVCFLDRVTLQPVGPFCGGYCHDAPMVPVGPAPLPEFKIFRGESDDE